ncbi:MAG: FHA domain-containing protein [Scytonema sp. PMC 1069.18]|nr:FHA domain-containing protein [Scytonema sp. PMC 1069.18]MEC4880564.1 FHA domain-containing protein [Scytonema sp. PMC 1070.18]
MISQVSEKKVHLVRWLLAVGWLILIVSLFYDPISPWLTDPSHPINFSRLDSTTPFSCIRVQQVCLPRQPYSVGSRIFWTLVIPSSIIILLVFGHEFWRRICPLYFFSQIPRALGIQRKRKIVNSDAGSVRYELAGVQKESWLGRNYLLLQFALLYLGLNIRILLVNGDRIALGLFLLLTIASAIIVGFLYKGKSWCQYFCPMAPVQMFFTGPRGLLGSEAHLKPPQSITQSSCRTVDSSGIEKSACVNCQSPCIDIDAERSYWEGITRPDQKLVFYGYFGLMLGYFVFFFLYAGNWEYYDSGLWLNEKGQLDTLFNPGLYIFNRSIPIPKLIAAPLTLAVFCALSYFTCLLLEKVYKTYLKHNKKYVNEEQVLHVCFVLCTFVSFNVFLFFALRPILNSLSNWLIATIDTLLVLVSSIWLYRSLGRSKELYSRESLANSLRRQLNKLAINWSNLLEGRSLQDLVPNEVYVLAKVLPGFKRADQVQVYQGVLREALEEGNIRSGESLEALKDLRQQLNVTDDEHYTVLAELGAEDPTLLVPQKQLSRENKLRIESYRRALDLLIQELVERGVPLQQAINRQQKQIQALRQEYAITVDEQEQVFAEMFNQNGVLLRTAETLLAQLQNLAVRDQILYNSAPNPQVPVYVLLRKAVQEKKKLIVTQLFRILELLRDSPESIDIARSTAVLAANVIEEILQSHENQVSWQKRLSPRVLISIRKQDKFSQPFAMSTQLGTTASSDGSTRHYTLDVTNQLSTNRTFRPEALHQVLLELLQDIDPILQAASLYALQQFNSTVGIAQARQIMNSNQNKDWLVQETARIILSQGHQPTQLANTPTLIAQVRMNGRVEKRVFQQPTIRVGRGHENDIVILDNRVSRQHAIFYLDDKGVSVKDLGSSNGIRINKEHIQDQQKQLQQASVVRLSSGDDLVILVQWEMRLPQEDAIAVSMGTLEKLLWLYDSSFFQGVKANALIELARNASLRVYQPQQEICRMGAPAAELQILIDGEAMLLPSNTAILPRQTIGELEVLTHSYYVATVIATGEGTQTLAIKAKDFEAALSQNPLLAMNVLEMMSMRLQESLGQAAAMTQI